MMTRSKRGVMATDSWVVRLPTLIMSGLAQYRPDHRWNYEFIKLMSRVMAIAFTSRPPPYAAILHLDRELRDFYVPPHLRLQWTDQTSMDNLLWIKRWVVLSNKEWGKPLPLSLGMIYWIFFAALLNIHRAYFSQALRENPLDPLRHRYGLSVMALYRSSFRLVEGCAKTCQACPPNFQFFRTNFASSKVLSVVVRISRPRDFPPTSCPRRS